MQTLASETGNPELAASLASGFRLLIHQIDLDWTNKRVTHSEETHH